MKKQIWALMLAVMMLLSGCTSMLERSDVSATPHVDYSPTEGSSSLRVETYPALVNSLLHFVSEHAETGSIRLYNYTGDVESDLKEACREVVEEDPLCAFVVEDIQYDSTRILTYYEVDLTISYTHTTEEVAAIRNVTGLSGLRQQLTQMVDEQAPQRVLLVSYFSGNADQILHLLTLARYSRPDLYVDGGNFSCDISIYPETGSRRIIEITVDHWDTGHPGDSDYAQQLEEAADLLLTATPPAAANYTPEEIVAILCSACGGYDFHGSHAALGPLSGQPASEMGVMMALEYLFQRCGIDVYPVVDLPNLWLIVATRDGYRHLLISDVCQYLLSLSDEDPSEEPFSLPLYTDEELEALGYYSWNRSLYPICEGKAPEPALTPAPTASPSAEPTSPAEEN